MLAGQVNERLAGSEQAGDGRLAEDGVDLDAVDGVALGTIEG